MAASLGVDNPFRYRGYYYDNETGLYYLNARYYNPGWGRFINADSYGGSTGKLLSHNVFIYCSNNPVMMSDPSGNREVITDDPNSREERNMQILYRIGSRLPERYRKHFYEQISFMNLDTLRINTSYEKVPGKYDPNGALINAAGGIGTIYAVEWASNKIAVKLLGDVAMSSRVNIGLSIAIVICSAAEYDRGLRRNASDHGVYTTYTMNYTDKAEGFNQIEIRFQPSCSDWQPYSRYSLNGLDVGY